MCRGIHVGVFLADGSGVGLLFRLSVDLVAERSVQHPSSIVFVSSPDDQDPQISRTLLISLALLRRSWSAEISREMVSFLDSLRFAPFLSQSSCILYCRSTAFPLLVLDVVYPVAARQESRAEMLLVRNFWSLLSRQYFWCMS